MKKVYSKPSSIVIELEMDGILMTSLTGLSATDMSDPTISRASARGWDYEGEDEDY